MALSYIKYTGNGTNSAYGVPFPYLEAGHVKVKLNNVATAFTFNSSSVINIVPPPGNGVEIYLYRDTPTTGLLVDFEDDAILDEAALDLMSVQLMYIAQETTDRSTDANSTAIDALVKANTAIASAQASEASVAIARAEAAYAVDTANYANTQAQTALNTANTASSTANTASSNATSAITASNNAVATANAAAASANSSATVSTTATNTANTALTTANGAVTTANAADTKATNAVTTANAADTKAQLALDTVGDIADGAVISFNGRGGAVIPLAEDYTSGQIKHGTQSVADVLAGNLTSLAGLTGATDKLPYFVGAGVLSLATLSAAARAVLDDPDFATMRATLGLLGAATRDVTTSPSDTTSGRLWRTDDLVKQTSRTDSGNGKVLVMGGTADGPFGIGGVPVNYTDANAVTWSGFARNAGLSASNTPNAGIHSLINLPYSNGMVDLGAQLAVQYSTTDGSYLGTPKLHGRSKSTPGVFGSWVEFAALQAANTWTGKQTFLGNQDFTVAHNINAQGRWLHGSYFSGLPHGLTIEYNIDGAGSVQPVKFRATSAGSYNDALSIYPFGDMHFHGYTKRGESGLFTKEKYLSLTTGATEGASVSIAHGVPRAKIRDVRVVVDTGANIIPAFYPGATFEFSFYLDGTNVVIINKAGSSANVLSKLAHITITYEI